MACNLKHAVEHETEAQRTTTGLDSRCFGLRSLAPLPSWQTRANLPSGGGHMTASGNGAARSVQRVYERRALQTGQMRTVESDSLFLQFPQRQIDDLDDPTKNSTIAATMPIATPNTPNSAPSRNGASSPTPCKTQPTPTKLDVRSLFASTSDWVIGYCEPRFNPRIWLLSEIGGTTVRFARAYRNRRLVSTFLEPAKVLCTRIACRDLAATVGHH
jgi:hypothetical protein